jgi:hypothetical protein
MTSTPSWPDEPGGPEARWRGEKGDKGDAGRTGGMTRGARRAFVTITILVFAISLMAFALGARSISQLTAAQRSQCLADRDISNVAAIKITQKPSRTLISFVAHERQAFAGLGCPGKLAPPDPSFTRWAKAYRLPYR